jgi:ParB family chromosome partitioning protein
MAKPALGRGLSALLGGVSAPPRNDPPPGTATPASLPSSSDQVLRVDIQRIRPCPFQPRKDFPAEALQELTESIRTQGVIQPLIVRKLGDGFEIIAGERRWRAAQAAQLTALPVIVREADDRHVLELALIENLQREDLNPVEEARGYAELIEKFALRQEDAAARVGKSRAAVANALRLLKLPPSLLEHLSAGRLSTGHAKVILGLPSVELQEKAATQILHRSLNVRQTEELVSALQKPASAPSPHPGEVRPPVDANIAALETRLREKLGTKVHLRYQKGKGSLDIRFFSDSDLQRVLDLLGVQMD